MTSIEKWVGYDYDTFDDVAAFYDFQKVSDLLNSDLIVYHDQTIDGLLCGVGMNPEELEKMLYRGIENQGYAQWSLYYLHFHDQYILINDFH